MNLITKLHRLLDIATEAFEEQILAARTCRVANEMAADAHAQNYKVAVLSEENMRNVQAINATAADTENARNEREHLLLDTDKKYVNDQIKALLKAGQ